MSADVHETLIRYLMQRPALANVFPEHIESAASSAEARALELLLGYLRHNAATAPPVDVLLAALMQTEFAAIYQRVVSLMYCLGDERDSNATIAKRITKYLGPAKLAKDAPQWSPSPASDGFLRSYEWRRVRMIVLKRDGTTCRCCGASPADGARVNVDHIKPRKMFPELALDPDNCQVLCEDCNHGKGNWDTTDWRQSDAEGR